MEEVQSEIGPIRLQESQGWYRVHTAAEKFENAASFLRFGLPSAVIRHENGAFWKRSFSKTLFKPEEFENAGFSFSCGQKTFSKRSFSKTMYTR